MKQFPTHIVAVFGVVERDEDILLLRHRDKDVWMFPGGQVEIGENLVDALLRETMEESNMEINVGRLFCVTSNTCTYQGYGGYGMVPTKVIFGFVCEYISGEFAESDETTEYRWVLKRDVLGLLTTPDSIDKYNAYLNFDDEITYLAYESRPEYKLNVDRRI